MRRILAIVLLVCISLLISIKAGWFELAALVNQVVSYFRADPPKGVVWVTIALAAITFLWKLVEFFVGRHEALRRRKLSVHDEFWFRSVIVPFFLEPLLAFVDDAARKLNALEARFPAISKDMGEGAGASVQEFLEEFKGGKEGVAGRAYLLGVHSGSLYRAIVTYLDELDDIVTEYCAAKALGVEKISSKENARHDYVRERLFEAATSVVKELMGFHGKM